MLFSIAQIVSLFWGLGHTLSVEDCPFNHDHLEFYSGTCYRFVLSRKSAHYAENDCRTSGGDLVMIKSKKVNDYIQRRLYDHYNERSDIWIGLTDLKKEGHWVWPDGTPAKRYFTNWGTLEGGHDYIRDEDCVAIDPSDGNWKDYGCEFTFWGNPNRLPYICQYAPKIINTTTTQVKPDSTSTATPSTVKETTNKGSTTPQPTTPQPTTPQPTTPQPTTPQPTTPQPTTPQPTTPQPTTPQPQATKVPESTAQARKNYRPTCPPFTCTIDCGMDGYKVNTMGCSACECDV